jgi:tetratricopeptide (TPR) repeat protein
MTGDRNRLFTLALVATWILFVALPILASVALERPFRGLPLLGVAIWFVLLRSVRWLTPPSRCERLLRRGQYANAVELCARELALQGSAEWQGTRRIAWLNRRTTALLGAGRLSEALTSALDALEARPDPETLAECGQCLLALNRYDEAERVARLAFALTRERSINALAVLADVLLAQGRPAEAQALAGAGLADISALLPFVQPAHHAALLAALARAERGLDHFKAAHERLIALRRVTRRNPVLQAQALLEEADALAQCDPAGRDAAFVALEAAIERGPQAVCWFLEQPYTLHELRDDPRFAPLAARARAEWLRLAASRVPPDAGAPPSAFVAMELTVAEEHGYTRPAAASSRRALAMQGMTLAGTLLLLVLWTWQFFLAGA